MKIYIASSWKNQHAVEMLTALLERIGHQVLSFVRNNHGEQSGSVALDGGGKPMNFDEWVWSDRGRKSFEFDTSSATKADLVIYIGPSGTDAWAEVGAAWASGIPIFGLHAKGEQAGLMRRMVSWFMDYECLLDSVKDHYRVRFSNGIKIFQMNEYDWYAAETIEAAIKAYCHHVGCSEEDGLEDPFEISSEKMDKLQFIYGCSHPRRGEKVSFRERLQEMLRDGEEFPCLFASTEF